MAKKISDRLSPVISILFFVIRRLPIKKASSLMAFVLTKTGNSFVKSKNMQNNIRQIFPDMGDNDVNILANKMLANFGRHVAEIAQIPNFRDGKNGAHIEFTSRAESPFDGRGPAIYVGGHVGSWELTPLVFHQMGQPVTVIYSPNSNQLVDDLMRTQRTQTGAHYVEKAKALRACHRALGRGEAIALLVDQRVDPGLEVQFFGRPTAISRLPAKLATTFDCPIVPFETVRLGPGHVQVNFQKHILPNGQKGKQVEFELTQQVASAVEGFILANVDAWFCSKLRWKRKDREKLLARAQLSNTSQLEAAPQQEV